MANISVEAIRSLINYLQILGVEKQVCLDKINMTNSQLLNRPMVNFDAYVDLYELSEKVLGKTNIGFSYGKLIEVSRWGILGQIAFTSKNLNQALLSQRQYQSIAGSLGTPRYLINDRQVTLIWETEHRYNYQIAEEIITSWVELARQITDTALVPNKVWFQHSCKTSKTQYEEFFNCPVEFESDSCGLIIPEHYLALPCHSYNPELNKVLRGYANTQVSQQVLTKIQEISLDFVLSQLPQTTPTISQLSDYLGMSTRNTQRKLNQAGTSFSKLIDDAKKDIAINYVTNTQMPFEQLSFMLNFSEQSAFNRAFKRWTSYPPAIYRRKYQVLHF